VTALRSDERNGYKLFTRHGTLRARSVVVATGPYQRARIPSLHPSLSPSVMQVHAGDYRNPASLPDGAVVVVGSGASGCQIADELVEAGRRVYLCVGRHQRVPRRYRGHDSFWWRRELGMLDETAAEVPPERRLPPPLVTGVHGGYDVDLRHSAARGLSLLGHLRGIDGDRMYFADDLDAQLRVGDRSLDEFLARVDQHIERTGLDAPSAPERTHRSPPPIHSPAQLDVRGERIGSVVWATGYDRDFSWVELPVLDPAGAPIHTRGVTAMQGLYFLGMPWFTNASRRSWPASGRTPGSSPTRSLARANRRKGEGPVYGTRSTVGLWPGTAARPAHLNWPLSMFMVATRIGAGCGIDRRSAAMKRRSILSEGDVHMTGLS
jgi:putative flavoprotein involved in K+ transport